MDIALKPPQDRLVHRVHVAVPSTGYLRDFVLDRLARRKEFVDVRTTVVFDYVQPFEQSELPDGVTR